MAPTQGRMRASSPRATLAHDMRVGDMGPRHADHVELAFGDGMARGRHIIDARGMEHRESWWPP